MCVRNVCRRTYRACIYVCDSVIVCVYLEINVDISIKNSNGEYHKCITKVSQNDFQTVIVCDFLRKRVGFCRCMSYCVQCFDMLY